MDNMEIFNLVKEVPDEARKKITAGRLKGMTDISPMWRIKKLTELFGPCGIGWWYDPPHYEYREANGEIKCFCDTNIYYKWGETISKPIPGKGGSGFLVREQKGFYVDDECEKKALTDAISVAAKALGVGADVYMGGDKTKYTGEAQDGNGLPPLPTPQNPPPPQQGNYPPPQQQTQRQVPAQQSTQPTPYFTCARCGKKLMPYNDSNGRQVSLRAHAEKSMQLFGEVLCLDCMPK